MQCRRCRRRCCCRCGEQFQRESDQLNAGACRSRSTCGEGGQRT